MNGSLTTSGRDRPNLASTSAIWRTAPPPICSMRGAAMLAFTAVMGAVLLAGAGSAQRRANRKWLRRPALKWASIGDSYDASGRLECPVRTTITLDDELVAAAQEYTGIQEKS